MTSAPTVTDNGSGQAPVAVTCSVCERGYACRPGDLRKHCRACHSDRHRACIRCAACLPDGHRDDRAYCGTTCRVKGHREREAQAIAHEVLRTEAPEEFDRIEAERATALAEYEAVIGQAAAVFNPPGERRPWQVRQELGLTADRCAGVGLDRDGTGCGHVFQAGDVLYRRGTKLRIDGVAPLVAPVARELLAYCARHACEASHHNRDLEDGWYYPDCHCPDDVRGRRSWRGPESCTTCGRMVAYHEDMVPGKFNLWATEPALTFCSQRCRQRHHAERRREERRSRDREHRCATCTTTFAAVRSDAMYCSAACRQKAHRRKAKSDAT